MGGWHPHPNHNRKTLQKNSFDRLLYELSKIQYHLLLSHLVDLDGANRETALFTGQPLRWSVFFACVIGIRERALTFLLYWVETDHHIVGKTDEIVWGHVHCLTDSWFFYWDLFSVAFGEIEKKSVFISNVLFCVFWDLNGDETAEYHV